MQVELPSYVFPPVTPVVSSPTTQRRSWEEAIARAEALRNLETDWNGQGSEAPNPADVDVCIRLLTAVRSAGRLPPPVFVSAASDGAVCVEWHRDEVRLEAEITTECVEWMLADGKRPAKFFETPLPTSDP